MLGVVTTQQRGSEKKFRMFEEGVAERSGSPPHRERVTKGAGVVFLRKRVLRPCHARTMRVRVRLSRTHARAREPLGLVSPAQASTIGAFRRAANADATGRSDASRWLTGGGRGDENGWINAGDVCVCHCDFKIATPTAAPSAPIPR